MFDKDVGMNGSNAIRAQHSLRKVAEIERHNFLSAAMNGGCEHVTIVGIG